MSHTEFASTSRGLQRDTLPMRLFEKAKRLGIWNPSAIDLRRDRQDWARLRDEERDLILRLTALFQAGEEAVTLDLLPLVATIAAEGRIEEELFLTSFLWEEAKHTDFFSRFLTEVAEISGDLAHYHTPAYRDLIYRALPDAMQRLTHDRSAEAQALAALTYNMIVEGVLAETGYHAYATMLEAQDLLPGTRSAIRLLKQDESRHIAYGIFVIGRLLNAEPQLWEPIEARLGELIIMPMAIIDEAFACYDVMPFGLRAEEFFDYAMGQFQKRLALLERARDHAGALDDSEYEVE